MPSLSASRTPFASQQQILVRCAPVARIRLGVSMRTSIVLAFVCLIAATAATTADNPTDAGGHHEKKTIRATVVATGIPGAGAITQIGTFHKGGPFAAAFAPFTEPGRILDRIRLFVASTSNFGAPLALPDQAPGSILSIDVSSGVVTVPPDFASAVDPTAAITPTAPAASAAGGNVMLYTAQNAAFLNGRNNPASRDRRPHVGEPSARHLAQQRLRPTVVRERPARCSTGSARFPSSIRAAFHWLPPRQREVAASWRVI